MTARAKKRLPREYPAGTPRREPTHPGALVEDVLADTGVSIVQAARALGISRQTLYYLMDGRVRVSPELAVKLGAFFGNGPGLWLRMQAAYDVWHAEHAPTPRVIPIAALMPVPPAALNAVDSSPAARIMRRREEQPMPKRERLSDTASGDHFIRRDAKGRIKEEVSAGKSIAQDRRVKAKTTVKPGYGDQGDVKPRAKKKAVKKVASKKRAPAKKK